MEMGESGDLEAIKGALRQNRLYVKTETGLRREITARCPEDGGPATVRTTYTARGDSGPEITSVVFRCDLSGHLFVAKAEDMELKL